MGAIEDHISRLAERLRKAETISAAFLAVQAQTQNPSNNKDNKDKDAPSSHGSDDSENNKQPNSDIEQQTPQL